MRIRILLFFCTAALVPQLWAQQVGLTGGINISSMHFSPPPSAYSTDVKVSSKAGIMFGSLLDIPLTKNSCVETGLIYDMKGLKLSGHELELRYTYHYLDIPLYFRYSYKGIFAAVGPYIGVALNGKVKLISVDTSLSEKIPIGSDPNSDGIKRMDAGINIKAGYELSNGFFFMLKYGLGLANVEPAVHTTEHFYMLTMGMGFYFNSKYGHSIQGHNDYHQGK